MALPVISTPQPKLPPPLKRTRGGQPRNTNARKLGNHSLHNPSPLVQIRLQVKALKLTRSENYSPNFTLQILKFTETLLNLLDHMLTETNDTRQMLDIHLLVMEIINLRVQVKLPVIFNQLKENTLASLAHDPLSYIESHFREQGIVRDADSFFFVSKLSARNSPFSTSVSPLQVSTSIWGSRSIPKQSAGDAGDGALNLPLQISSSIWGGNEGGVALPPSPYDRRGAGGEVETNYATDLTDAQWAVLAPLIPPDPHIDYLTGTPPIIIAANRWKFNRYFPTGEIQDMQIMAEYNQVLSKFPALQTPFMPSAKKRGRPKNQLSPRLLLNAIFWKLATGNNWDDLPLDFPPMRLCRKYYRRLFLSGRLYTILLALYNHLRLEENIDIYELYEQGIFTTTPSQAIALKTEVPPTNKNYMALLFMQLAREAYSYLDRLKKEDNRFYQVLPVFKGTAKLSNAALPFQERIPTFEPLESSRAAKKFRKAERNQKTIARFVKRNMKKQKETHEEK